MNPPKPESFPPDGKKEQEERAELLRELAALTYPLVLKPRLVR